MRPRIGKGKWWDKVTPTEQKVIDKTAKRYAVGELLEYRYGGGDDRPNPLRRILIVRDGDWYMGNVKILISNLTERDAHMWAKMID